MSGFFITFEGGEGAGKTTLINGLAEHLTASGYRVLKTKEPGGSRLGKVIRSALLDKEELFISSKAELLLFLADRANHLEEIICPALKRGDIVLCDRFNDSTIAYQGASNQISLEQIHQLITFATAGIVPDITFYLDIDPKIGLTRARQVSHDRMEKKSLEFHQKVRENFLKIANNHRERIKVLNGEQTIEQIKRQALDAILKRLK